MKFYTKVLGLLLGAVSASAVMGGNMVPNGSFEDIANGKPWKISSAKIRVARGLGNNGTTGVLIPPRAGKISVTLTGKILAENNYKYSAWFKVPRSNAKPVGVMRVTLYQQGKIVFRNQKAIQCHGNGWEKIESPLVLLKKLPDLPVTAVLDIHSSTKQYPMQIDDVRVELDKPRWVFNQLYPLRQSVSNRGGKVKFSSLFYGKFLPEGVVPEVRLSVVKYDGKNVVTVSGKYENERIYADFPAMKPGEYKLKAALLHKGRILGAQTVPFQVVKEPVSIPANSCIIDEYGRAIVNGKPFMPMAICCYGGVYITVEEMEQNIKDISTLNVNTVLPFAMFYTRTREELMRKMDMIHKYKLKVLFSLSGFMHHGVIMGKVRVPRNKPEQLENEFVKLINLVKVHPALLAWFADDESPISRHKMLARQYHLLSRTDRFHPVLSVYYQAQDFAEYAKYVDILGFDAYPVRTSKSTYENYEWWAQEQQRTGRVSWPFPQVFNWNEKKFRNPSENDIFSQAVFDIIYGARGFVWFSFGKIGKMEKKAKERRMAEIRRGFARVNELEKFVLSTQKDIPVTVAQKKGLSRARCIKADDGTIALFVVTIKHRNEAVITIPSGLKLQKSFRGMMKEISPGKILFNGGPIDGDVAILVKK